jgi:tyrosyl-tRNA synthetase
VLKADGTKFGKSEEGTVWLDPGLTSPYRFYQFFLGTEDQMVGTYLRYFTFLDHAELLALDAETLERPQECRAQRVLAREVCTLVHGSVEADRAERASRALFAEEITALDERTLLDVVQDAPSTSIGPAAASGGVESLTLVDALVLTGLASSKAQARRTIEQGGAYVNNRRERDLERVLGPQDLLHGRYVVLRRGSRSQHLLRVQDAGAGDRP